MLNPVEDLASQVCATQPPGAEQFAPAALIPILIQILQSCTKEAARKAMLIAGKRPNGMIANAVKRKIKERLPQSLNTPAVVDLMMTTTAKAAENQGLWDVVYEFRDLQPKGSGAVSEVPFVWEQDAAEGDGETHVS